MKPTKETQVKSFMWNTTNHRPTDEAIAKIEVLRHQVQELGAWYLNNSEVTPDQTIAMHALEEFTMKAVANIARTETEDIKETE